MGLGDGEGGEVFAHPLRGTLPYVTEIMATSSSSGLLDRASSIARVSSTPGFRLVCGSLDTLKFVSLRTWIGVDDDTVWSHVGIIKQ